MTDLSMNTKQEIYDVFILAVETYNASQAAEILYTYSFIIDALDKFMPNTHLTPYMHAANNSVDNELLKVLKAFSLEKQSTTIQESSYMLSNSMDSIELLSLNSSEGSEEKLTQNKNTLLAEVIKKYNLETIHQLYILTGNQPVNCDRSIDSTGKKGPHLRFVFPIFNLEGKISKKILQHRMILKLLNIHYNDEFGSQKDHFLTITPDQYPVINQIFISLMIEIKQEKLQLHTLSNSEKLFLFDILFSEKYLSTLKLRNNDKYPLTNVIHLLEYFIQNNNPYSHYFQISAEPKALCFSANAPMNIMNNERSQSSPASAHPTQNISIEPKRKSFHSGL